MKLDNYAPRSEQTTRNQRRELHAVAERHGWHVVATYDEDAGVSGAKGRDKRPGFDRLMMAVARREIEAAAEASAKAAEEVMRGANLAFGLLIGLLVLLVILLALAAVYF